MLKQLLLSCLAGVVFTIIALATPSTKAACQGYCADKHLKDGCELSYAGCIIDYDENDRPIDAVCFYAGSCDGPAPRTPPSAN
jgi:hypothetical protein